jgi:flagellin-like protein
MKRKMRTKSRKALSPVVASIILIAVTVAVSIAVAAWMGALTFGFMGSSSLTITNAVFNGPTGPFTSAGANAIVLSVKNTGTKQVTIQTLKINNIDNTPNLTTNSTMTYAAGTTGTIYIALTQSTNPNGWVNGNPYKIDLYDASGTGVGSTQANAPGA